MTETSTPDQGIDETTTQSRRRRMPWWAWAAIAAVVAIAAAITVPLSVSAANHATALDAYLQATSTARAAADSAAKAAADLAASSSAATSEADALHALVDQTPGDLLADPAVRDAAAAAIAQLRTTAAPSSIRIPNIGAWGTLEESASTAELTSAADNAASHTSTASALVDQVGAAQAKISKDLATAQSTIDDLVASAAAKGATLVYDRAGDGEKQTLAAAVAALQARKSGSDRPSTADTATLVNAYVNAVTAAKASHDAAIAADQSNSGNRDSGGSGGGWGGSTGGGSAGGSSGSGGSSGGWGGSGGGSSGGGNSGGGPVSYPRGSVVHSSSACTGSGGSASANWASNLMPPADSTVTNVWENQAGDAWGISWQCNAIDF